MNTKLDVMGHEARILWRDFLRRLDWDNRALPDSDREEIRAEATAHIEEALKHAPGSGEVERLRWALSQYGDLPPAPPVWRKPLAFALHYGSIPVIGFTSLVVAILLHMCVMEILNPPGVGLWVYPSGSWSLSYEAQTGAEEILGLFFIPAVLTFCAVSGLVVWALWRLALGPSGPVAGWMKD